MFKGAMIRSREEAKQRMINGEVFHFRGEEIRFDRETQKFLCGESEVDGLWGFYAAWMVKFDWRESIGTGRFCWVWNKDFNIRFPALVTAYREGFYETHESRFNNAELMKREEIMQFVKG